MALGIAHPPLAQLEPEELLEVSSHIRSGRTIRALVELIERMEPTDEPELEVIREAVLLTDRVVDALEIYMRNRRTPLQPAILEALLPQLTRENAARLAKTVNQLPPHMVGIAGLYWRANNVDAPIRLSTPLLTLNSVSSSVPEDVFRNALRDLSWEKIDANGFSVVEYFGQLVKRLPQ